MKLIKHPWRFSLCATLLIVVLVLAGCDKKEKNRCLDFRTGTFKFLNPEFRRFTVVRNQTTQTEIDSLTGLSMTGDVDWISDCSYKVTYTKVSDEKYVSIVGATSTITILAVFDNKITCKSEGLGGEMEVEMVRIGP